jgi:hypothetical protein
MENDILSMVGKRLGDISDLPEELRKQLSFTELDQLEAAVLNTLNTRFEGIASIDEIMVGLFRDSNMLVQRAKLASKLYRMAKAGHVKNVPKKRGIFSI